MTALLQLHDCVSMSGRFPTYMTLLIAGAAWLAGAGVASAGFMPPELEPAFEADLSGSPAAPDEVPEQPPAELHAVVATEGGSATSSGAASSQPSRTAALYDEPLAPQMPSLVVYRTQTERVKVPALAPGGVFRPPRTVA